MNITGARVSRQMNVPLSKLRSTTHFQGAGWAKDPKTGTQWFFQMQVAEVGPGAVEDLYVHRYSLRGTTLTYVDTMLAKTFGHCQTVKVRISAAGNAQLWLGLETYSTKHGPVVTVGTRVYKVRYRPGTITRSSDDVIRVWTGGGNYVAPIGCPDWTIALRRPDGAHEIYEWHDERKLMAATEENPAVPAYRLVVPKAGTYQGAYALGSFDAPGSILRLNGLANVKPQWLMQFTSKATNRLDVTNILTGTGGGRLEEPESVLEIDGVVHVVKQTSPHTSKRIVGVMALEISPVAIPAVA